MQRESPIGCARTDALERHAGVLVLEFLGFAITTESVWEGVPPKPQAGAF